ncbi:MAG: histidine phosphatase family protein [Candidatus Eremiobacteraeota bacterium]|nr:histidine phosphatase family protein [Candidatus Eremiobacteraeota bacterium]
MHLWPEHLVLVRHGQSIGNVARERALAEGAALIHIDAVTDSDVPLSPLGREQSQALGRWFAGNEKAFDPILTSPFKRAAETAELMREAAGWEGARIVADARLGEKGFGELDRLTRAGIAERFPEQVALRHKLGKMHYRPPGGESWDDVIVRLRGVADSLKSEHAGKRVAIVSHQVIVVCLRYLLENLSEEQLLAIDRGGDVANCSITEYRYDPAASALRLERFNFSVPVAEQGAPVTAEPSQSAVQSN